MKLLSFVIPCYRSEKTIERVIDEIEATVSERVGYSFEVICVNDQSPDDVESVIRAIAEKDDRIKLVNLAKNMGKHAAVLAGYSYAQGEIIVNLDDDLQSPVDNLWQLIEPLEKDICDCSMAHYSEKKQAVWKNMGSKFNEWVGNKMLDRPSGFRFDNFWAIKKFIADEMIKYPNSYPFLEGLLLRSTNRIVMIPMEERERGDDNSTGYTLKKSIALFSNGFTSFSVKPLRISTMAGIISAMIGFVWAIIILIKKLCGTITVAGYASTTVIQLIIGGLILMSLGLLGEYIGRIYISINKAPQYIVRDTLNVKSKDTK